MKLVFKNENFKPKIAILIPAYNEENNIEYSYDCLGSEFKSLVEKNIISKDSIILYIDDGSTDETFKRIKNLKNKDIKIKAISLQKNYGHQYALLAAYKYLLNKVDAFISIDCDLQHDFTKIDEFIHLYRKGYDVVNSKRVNRDTDSILKKYFSNIFYFIYYLISGENINGYSDFRLISNNAAKELLKKIEHPPFIRGAVNRLNLSITKINTLVKKRKYGETKYSFKKMLFLALSSFFSNKKIVIFLILLSIIILELFYAIYILFTYIYNENLITGWSSIIISITFSIILITIVLIQNIKNNSSNPDKKHNLKQINIKDFL